MTIGEIIKEARERIGLTQDELAIRVGYKHKASINKIENGERKLMQDKILAFADALHITPEQLMGWEPISPINNDAAVQFTQVEISIIEKYRALDTHGHQVVSFLLDAEYERVRDIMAASRGEAVGSSGTIAVPLLQDALSRKVIGTVPVAANENIPGSGDDLFAWKVDTNAMAPRIASGDTVIVHKQDDVNSGDIAVVLLDGVQVVCKQVIKEGDRLTLVPLNNKYQTRVFKQEDIKKRFKILGRVVENIQAV